jgi:hypothetical protein
MPFISSRRRGPLLIALVGLALGFAFGWQAREFVAVDGCLDAGGAWAAGLCRDAR